jgi:hypothetical protein
MKSAPPKTSKPQARKPAAGSPAGPASPVPLTGERKKLFDTLSSRYVLEDATLALVQESCRALERSAELAARVDADGPVVVDRFGGLKPHPALVLERDFRGLACRTLAQLVARLET